MPGPMSTPNNNPTPGRPLLLQSLSPSGGGNNEYRTGKTVKDNASGKWERHNANRRARGDRDRDPRANR